VRRALAVLIALVALTAAASPALAASANFYEVEAELMCDTCNVPLNIAESARADQQRAEIHRLIAQGKTKEEILDVFVAEYGPNVLSDPSKAGGSPAVWAVPLGLLLAAVAAIALLLPRWRRRRREEPDGAPAGPARALSDEDEDRLKRDLALYDL
jgi:cytochrome c-type biogenesis protein CcmH